MNDMALGLGQVTTWMSEAVSALSVALLAPFKSGTLLYWPFLCSAIIVTIILYAARGRLGEFARQYLRVEIWWHPSARADYLLYLVNAALVPVVFAPFFAVSLVVAKQVRDLLDRPSAVAEMPDGLAILAYNVVIFVAYDFGRYLGHWIQHKSSVLWEFHKVHHSAEVLTPVTSFRVHPVDLLIMSMVPALFTGLVTGATQSLAGPAIGPITVFSMHALTAAYHATSHLRHSSVWLSYGPKLSHIFVSPAQHQIHHSYAQCHLHRNLGWALAVWDWLFGTLYVPTSEEKFAYGLGDGTEADYHGVLRMYLVPFVQLWRHLKRTPRFSRGS